MLPSPPRTSRHPSTSPSVSRAFRRGLAVAGLSVFLLVLFGVPMLAAPAAHAAPTLTVTAPTDGAAVDPATLLFRGTGAEANNTIVIAYERTGGITASATSSLLPPTVATDLTWTAAVSFGGLGTPPVDVDITVTEHGSDGERVGDPVDITLTVGSSPAQVLTFAITEPVAGTMIRSYRPTVVGSAAPGESVLVSVAGDDGQPVPVGDGLADGSGAFMLPLDLGRVDFGRFIDQFDQGRVGGDPVGQDGADPFGRDEDRAMNITLEVTRVAADGTLVPDNVRNVAVIFAPTIYPFTPNAPGIVVSSARITVADATDRNVGVPVFATGFDAHERITITLIAPDGGTIDVAAPGTSDALGQADETGSVDGPLVLPGTPQLGAYSVTVAGTASGVSLIDSFELVDGPVGTAPGTAVLGPRSFAAPPGQTDGARSAGAADPAHTPGSASAAALPRATAADDGALPGTGPIVDALPITAIAVALLAGGAALLLLRQHGTRSATRTDSADARTID